MKKKELIEVLGKGTWSERIQAATEIFERFDDYSSDIILGLTDDEPDIRYWCLKILTEKDAVKFGSFGEALLEDDNWFVRCQAIYSLYLSDKHKYSKIIEKAVMNERDEQAIEFLEKNIA